MKLSIEIKDEKFIYNYTIGENTHSSERHLCAESLVAFVDALRICSQHFRFADKEWERKALEAAWIEKRKGDLCPSPSAY